MKYADGAEFNQFQKACREIGAILAAGGHTLVVGSDNKRTADRYVAEGAASIAGRHKIIVHFTDGPEPEAEVNDHKIPFFDGSANVFPHIEFNYKKDTGPWSLVHTAAIYDSDVVLVIGGGRRCDLAGHIAAILGKPVLPIPIFGGAAERISSELDVAYSNEALSDHENESIRIRWLDTSASAVGKAVSIVFKHNHYTQSSSFGLVVLGSIGVLSLALWVAIFIFAGKDAIAYNPAFFGLSILSVFMGTSLRVTTAALQNPNLKITLSRVYAELAAASILAFGFILLYFVGGFIIVGRFNALATQDDFARVGISFSLIGLAAAFLFERALQEFGKQIGATVFHQAK